VQVEAKVSTPFGGYKFFRAGRHDLIDFLRVSELHKWHVLQEGRFRTVQKILLIRFITRRSEIINSGDEYEKTWRVSVKPHTNTER